MSGNLRKGDKEGNLTDGSMKQLGSGKVSSALYHTAILISEAQKPSKSSPLPPQFRLFLGVTIYTTLCLALYTNIADPGHSLDYFWSFSLWLRVDYLCWRLKKEAVYVVWGYVALHTITLLYVFYACLTGARPGLHKLSYLIPMLKWRITTALDVPLSALLLSRGSFLLQPRDSTPLYNQTSDLPSWTEPISLLCFFFLWALQCFREFVSTEMDHSECSSDVYARSGSGPEYIRLLLIHIMTVSYFCVAEISSFGHLAVVLGCCGGVVVVYGRRMPFYHERGNETVVGCFAFVGASAVVEMVAILVGSGVFSALGTLFVAPVIGGLAAHHLRSVYSYFLAIYSAKLSIRGLDLYQVEIALRGSLCNIKKTSTDDEKFGLISSILAQYHFRNRPKLLLFSLIDLSLHICENDTFTRLKLYESELLPNDSSSLDLDFLAAKYRHCLRSEAKSDPLDFFIYSQKLRYVQKVDKDLCLCLLLFLKVLISKHQNQKKVTYYSLQIAGYIKQLNAIYALMLKAYPKSQEIAIMYSSFLFEIQRKNSKAESIRMRANTPTYEDGLDIVSFFQQDNGVVFAEVCKGNFGGIFYANELAHRALGYDKGTMIGRSILNLIPRPYRDDHAGKIREFLSSSKSMNLDHSMLLYLSTASDNLLETLSSLTLTSIDTPPVILLAFKPTFSPKQTAILTPSLTLASYTTEFPQALGYPESTSLLGLTLKEADPELWSFYEQVGLWRCFVTRNGFGLFSEEQISGSNIAFLHIFEKKEEANDWIDFGRDGLEVFNDDKSLNRSCSLLSRDFKRSVTKKASVQFSRGSLRQITIAKKQIGRKGLGVAVSIATTTSGSGRMYKRNTRILTEMMSHFWILKLVTVIAMTALLTGSIIIGSFVNSAVTEVVARDHSSAYILRQLQVLRAAQNARHADIAIRTSANYERIEQYKSVIGSTGKVLAEIQRGLTADSYLDDIRHFVNVWEVLDEETTMKRSNIFDAIGNFADQSILISDLNSTDMTLSNSHLYYIFRNGLGETYNSLQKSVQRYISRTQQVIRSATTQTFAYFLPFTLLLAVTSGVSFYFLYRIQKKVSTVSMLLCCFPTETYLETRELVTIRFKRLHDEGEDLEKLIPFAGEGKGGVGGTYECGTLLIGLLFIMSMGWYAVEYFVIIGDVSDTLLLWPEVVNLTIERVTNMSSLWTWMLEAVIFSNPILTSLILPGPSVTVKPIQAFEWTYQLNKKVEVDMFLEELSGKLGVSEEQLAVLYLATNFTCAYMKKGYSLGLKLLQEDLKSNAATAEWSLEQLNTMYSCIEEIMNNASYINSIYDHELANNLMSQMSLLIWFIVAHSIINLLGMSYGVYWAISRTDTQVRAMWKTLGLFSETQDTGPQCLVPTATLARCSTALLST